MNNVIAYSSQVLLLVAGGALLALIFRPKLPKVRLWFWQGLLAVCLLLPFVQPRRVSQISFDVQEGPMPAGTPVKMAAAKRFPIAETLIGIYAAGVALRAAWLLLGCWRLRRYRRQAIDLYPVSPALVGAQKRLTTFPDIRLSTEITTPVTFGILDPVILLPPSFLDLDGASQQAIAVHELMHVKRGDWLFSLSEEIVRSIFWFHPAIWWLLAQIQLTREQVVDRATVEFTLSREQYLEALLAVAKTKVRPDLALAPLFLKKRHLARRVAAVMKEVHMSKRQIISSFATIFTLALVTARVAVWVFPLESSAQESRSEQIIAVRVIIDTPGYKLLHGSRIDYPNSALEKRVEGTVVLQLSLNAAGEVSDARVVSGPDELRSAALSSALQWHFANESGQPATIQASLVFKAPPSTSGQVARLRMPQLPNGAVVRKIEYANVPESLRENVQRRLSLREGDPLNAESYQKAAEALREIDEHLALRVNSVAGDGSSTVVVVLMGGVAPPPPAAASGASSENFNPPPTEGVKRIRVGGNIQSSKLTMKQTPLYPALAKQARIQGTVRYNVLIGNDGLIRTMDLVSGHPLLVEAATSAVQQWQYQPTLLNGVPVEVLTVIDVNFTLSQ